MYEIEFVIPVNNTEPTYKKRLADFKKIGLLNMPKDKKIKVVLLAKKQTISPRVKKGWPKNCDLVIKEHDNDLHIFKLCEYYLDLKKFNSKWYVTVDDDSVTNIGGLINSLSNYSLINPVYLSTPYTYDKVMKTLEIKIVEKLKLLHFLKNDWSHDWESHYINRAAMIQILKNPNNRKYIRKRKKTLSGFTDQFMNYASKIAGINPIVSNFSSPHAEIDNFSLFNGHLDHIHYVAHDYKNTDVFINWFKNNS